MPAATATLFGLTGSQMAGLGGMLQGGSSVLGGLFGSGGGSETTSTKVLPFGSRSGLGSARWTGSETITDLDPRYQQAQNQLLGLSGSQFGQLGAFSNTPFQQSQPFDLGGFTQDQYNLLESIQGRGRQEATQGLEERLYAQGRLGSTGGISEQRNLQDAISQQQSQNLASAFGQGLAGQQQQFGQDIAASQQQNAQQQLLSSIGQGLFASALTPEQLLLQQLQTGGSLSTVSQSESSSGNEGGLFSGF